MKILLDNNVIIDFYAPNAAFKDDAEQIFMQIAALNIPAYLCANSLTDIYYILRKENGIKRTKADIAKLLDMFNIIPLTEEDCSAALSLDMNDYEDAIIMACAHKAGVDFIISRDKDFIKTSFPVSVITPADYLKNYLKVKT